MTHMYSSFADIELAQETQYDVGAGDVVEISEKLTGSGSIRKTGAGRLVVKNGLNDFSGGVKIENGVVNGETAKSFGTGAINVGSCPAAVWFGVEGSSATVTYGNDLVFDGDVSEGLETNGNTDGKISLYFYSNTVLDGDVTANRDIRIRVKTTSSSPLVNSGPTGTFNGPLNASGRTVYVDSYVDMVFNAPLTAGKVYFADQWSAGGKVSLNSSGNSIGEIYLGNERIVCGAQNVLGNASFIWYPTGDFQNNRSTVNLNGRNQKLKSLSFFRHVKNSQWDKTRFNTGTKHCVFSDSPALLTLTGNESEEIAFATLRDKVSLLVDAKDFANSFTQRFVHGESTMSGSLMVSNGTLVVETDARFPNVETAIVGENGTFILTTTNDFAALKSLKRLEVAGTFDVSAEKVAPFGVLDALAVGENASLKFPEGTRLVVRSLNVAGEELKVGTYGVSSFPQFENCSILNIGSGAIDLAWTGEGSNKKISTAANWNQSVNVADVLVSPVFALGGGEAIIDKDFFCKNIVFSPHEGSDGFSLAPDEAKHNIYISGDITVDSSNDAKKYEIAAPVNLFADTLVCAAQNQTLTFKDAFKNGGSNEKLTLDGKGTVVFDGTNRIDGIIFSITNNWIVRGYLGVSGDLNVDDVTKNSKDVIYIKHSSKNTTGFQHTGMILDNAVVEKSMFVDNNIGVPCIESKAGTTNEIKGNLTFTCLEGKNYGQWQPVFVMNKSELLFSGGVHASHSFRLMGGGVMRFANRPVVAMQYGGLNPVSGKVILEVAGNTFTNVCLGYDCSYKGNAEVDMRVSNAMTNGNLLVGVNSASVTQPSSSGLGGYKYTVNLNTTTQKCDKIAVTSIGTVKGNYPSMIVIQKGKSPSDHDGFCVAGKVDGGAGFRMAGNDDATLLLKNTQFESSGDIEVVSGTLEFANGATWLNGKYLSVSGTGVLKLNYGDVFASTKAELSLSGNGKVNVPAGVKQTFARVYVESRSLPPGVYTSANLPAFVTGGGAIEVYNPGTLLFVR